MNTSTSENELFAQNVQKWVVLDKQLKYVNEKTRQIREAKNDLTTEICEYIQRKQWTDKPIEITNGTIKFIEKREYSPLSFAYIEECLDKIISDASHVDFILQYLKDNREVKTACELRRTNV